MVLVMNSAAVFSWEMGSWLVRTDVLLKTKVTQEGEKNASKEQAVEKINLRPIYLVGNTGKINLCRSKTGGNIGVFPEGSFWRIKWDAKKTPITKVLRLLVQKASSYGVRQ